MPPKSSLPTPPTVVIRKKRRGAASPTSAKTSIPLPSRSAPSAAPPPSAPPVEPAQPLRTDAPLSAARPSRKQRDAQARYELMLQLQERWPHLFPRDRRKVKPLALGIHHEILKELPMVKPYLLRQAIGLYQQGGNGAYWRAILKGGSRYRLDGTPEGAISAKDQVHAREALAAVTARWLAKRAGRENHTKAERQFGQVVEKK